MVGQKFELTLEEISIESKSGTGIDGWYWANVDSTATVLLFHPVRGSRRDMIERAMILHDAGFAVVLIDLQAHGESSGEQITFGYREKYDVQSTIEYARSVNPDHKIGIIGWSLGGAATLLAKPENVDAVVLESVYPTIEEAVANRLEMRIGFLQHFLSPILLWQLPLRLGINTNDLRPIDSIGELNCPVLVLAGDQDEHTTLAETERLYESANLPKQLVIFEGAKHQDLRKYDSAKYEQNVIPFLKSNLDQVRDESTSKHP